LCALKLIGKWCDLILSVYPRWAFVLPRPMNLIGTYISYRTRIIYCLFGVLFWFFFGFVFAAILWMKSGSRGMNVLGSVSYLVEAAKCWSLRRLINSGL
jgi:hypothetical protein